MTQLRAPVETLVMSPESVQVLTAARQMLADPSKWNRAHMFGENGEVCALGAVARALGYDGNDPTSAMMFLRDHDDVINPLAQQCKYEPRGFLSLVGADRIWFVNDDLHRGGGFGREDDPRPFEERHAEMLSYFDKAIESELAI